MCPCLCERKNIHLTIFSDVHLHFWDPLVHQYCVHVFLLFPIWKIQFIDINLFVIFNVSIKLDILIIFLYTKSKVYNSKSYIALWYLNHSKELQD